MNVNQFKALLQMEGHVTVEKGTAPVGPYDYESGWIVLRSDFSYKIMGDLEMSGLEEEGWVKIDGTSAIITDDGLAALADAKEIAGINHGL